MYTPYKLAGSITATIAVLALGGLLDAAVAASTPTPPTGACADRHGSMHGSMHGQARGGKHGHEAMMAGPGMQFMHALHQLELSDAQHDKVRALMAEEHEKLGMAADGPPADFIALGNPGDPKHAAAVEAAKQRAAGHVQQFADIEQKVYALLTPEQQAKLPQLLADEQQHLQERRSEHAGHDGPPRR